MDDDKNKPYSIPNVLCLLGIAKEVDEEGKKYIDTHQGQYPAICIMFKDAKGYSFDEAMSDIKLLIRGLYRQHQHHLEPDRLFNADNNSLIIILMAVLIPVN